MTAPLMKYFAFEHLQGPLRMVSQQCAVLAQLMDTSLPDGPEKTAGLRKLLEGKDCFVRAALDIRPPGITSNKTIFPDEVPPLPGASER